MCPQLHTCPSWNASCTSSASNSFRVSAREAALTSLRGNVFNVWQSSSLTTGSILKTFGHNARHRLKHWHNKSVNLTPTILSLQQLLDVTPTKGHKKNHAKHLLQGHCSMCDAWTTHVCRKCQSNLGPISKKQIWICSKSDKVCMGWLILVAHPDMVAPAGSAKRVIHWGRVIWMF